MNPATDRRLGEAHFELVGRGEEQIAEELVAELREENPGFHPALVLQAQLDFFRRDYDAAIERLVPVVDELPTYTAAQLLLGRSAEKTGDVLRAFASYDAVARVAPVAAERAGRLRSRATEILGNRVRDALDRGRTDEAGRALQELERLAGDEVETLEVAALYADRVGDPRAELEAVRVLAERSPGDQGLLLRRADLELEAGDVGVGLRILQDLADRSPDDPVLEERLAQAKLRWRLQLLPVAVQKLAGLAELTRSEFAGLVYWLFPDVRYGRGEAGTIANDIFDSPFRDEIVRVVNLGLMEVDVELHQFGPGRPVLRGEVLATFLRLLQRRSPPLACLAGHLDEAPESISRICSLSARCGVIPEEQDCLPGAPISGSEALEMSRKSLELLEAS